jgi:hypothetical protein
LSPVQVANDCIAAVSPAGDRVLLHVPSGTYLRLEGSSSAIFDALAESEDQQSAAAAVAARFSIPMERAEADVASVIDTLSALRASRGSRTRRLTGEGAIDVARRWWRLPLNLRLAVPKAACIVAAVEVGLRTMDVGRLASLMRVPLVTGLSEAPAPDAHNVGTLTTAEARQCWASGWVLDRWLYEGTCLRRALAAGFILRRHHPVLRLGLIDDGNSSHAWVEAEGMTFNAIEVTGTFVPSSEWPSGRSAL